MDETRENVASMADVAADPKRAAFRDEVLRMLHRGEEPPSGWRRIGKGDGAGGVCLLI